MKFAFLIQRPGIGGLASMHDRMQEALEQNGHNVDRFIVQNQDVISKAKEGDYDVVHLYFTPFLNSKFFLRLLKFNLLSDKKIFVNYYNIKPENTFRRTMKRIFLPLLCDKVLLPSKNMEAFYREEIGISNTAILRPIVEDKFFDVEPSGDNIIYFGHARPDKGIDRVMEISSEEEPVHCYFIQPTEHILDVHPKMEEKIKNREIILHENEMPIDALSNAKLSLFPFHNLNKTVDIPLALVESLAAGVPILTSDLPPLNHYLPEEFLISNWARREVNKKTEKMSSEKYRKLARETAIKMGLDKDSVSKHYLEIISDL